MNVKVFLAFSLVVLLGFAMNPSQAQSGTTETPVAQMIQPGWTFSISHESDHQTLTAGQFTIVNNSNSVFLMQSTSQEMKHDDGNGVSDMVVIDVLQQGQDPETEPAGIVTNETSTGAYGYESSYYEEQIIYDFGSNQNITQTNSDNQPYQSFQYHDENMTAFVPMNDTYMPIPEFFFMMLDKDNGEGEPPALAQDENNDTPPIPIQWLFGNLSMAMPQIETYTETLYNVQINGMYFTIDATVVHFFVVASYSDSGQYYDDGLQATMNYYVSGDISADMFLYYDASGLFIKQESTFLSHFDFQINGVASLQNLGPGDGSNPPPDWDVWVNAEFHMNETGNDMSSLISISDLYLNGETTTSQVTTTEPTNTNSTDTNSTSPPELPLPGFTFTTAVVAFTALMAPVIIRKKH